MGWFTGIMVYLIIWWLVLFMVLPWGIKVPDTPEPGHATSAPEKPMLWRKAAVTTAVATVFWICTYFIIESDLISFREPPS